MQWTNMKIKRFEVSILVAGKQLLWKTRYSKQEKETTSSGLNKTTNCNKVATTKITLEEKHATVYHMSLCSQHTFKFKNSVSAHVKIMCHAMSSQQTELLNYSVCWPLHRCKSWHSDIIDLDGRATLKTSAFTSVGWSSLSFCFFK